MNRRADQNPAGLPAPACPISNVRWGNAPHARSVVRRGGFSLLEVVLALAILTGAIVVLGEVARMGMRNAQVARDMSQAQLLCESKMAEITSGITPADPVYRVPFDTLEVTGETAGTAGGSRDLWYYSIETQTTQEDGLMEVCVTVQQSEDVKRPVEFRLVRWMLGSAVESSEASAAEGSSSESSGTGRSP
jgi:general secretion pathway protein I